MSSSPTPSSQKGWNPSARTLAQVWGLPVEEPSEANDNGNVWLTLPFPPSTNNLFVNAGKRGRVRSSRYDLWLKEAGWELQAQRPPKIKGRVAVTIALCPIDKRRRDADNGCKAILDLLVKHQVIEADDSRIVRSITAKWVDVGAHCSVFVERTA